MSQDVGLLRKCGIVKTSSIVKNTTSSVPNNREKYIYLVPSFSNSLDVFQYGPKDIQLRDFESRH